MKEDYNFFIQALLREKAFTIIDAIDRGSIGNYTVHYGTWKREQNIIKYFRKELTKKDGQIKVLDIGCADGLWIFFLNSIAGVKKRTTFYGIDISPLAINFAEEVRKTLDSSNVVFEVGDVENLNLQSSYFDIIICAELIEHLTNPDKFLDQLTRILKPGGLAIITTPNRSNPLLKFKNIFYSLIGQSKSTSCNNTKNKPAFGYGHISVKGLNEWIKIIKRHGFKIEGIKRGSLFLGGAKFDAHPSFFVISLILDIILDHLPFTLNFTENITFKLRRPYSN